MVQTVLGGAQGAADVGDIVDGTLDHVQSLGGAVLVGDLHVGEIQRGHMAVVDGDLQLVERLAGVADLEGQILARLGEGGLGGSTADGHAVYIGSRLQSVEILKGLDAILVPGGFGYRGVEGMITTARFARENNIPYLGICLGMQVALIDYARHVANMENANSTEFVPDCKYPVVALITEWRDENGNVEVRSEKSDLGGTMRLGAQQCQLVDDSLVRQLYNAPTIVERHRHRYEVNNMLLKQIEDAGLRVAGRSGDDQLVEIIEVPNHPWFVACQFHPEFTSTPRDGHPLFAGFVKAASEFQKRQAK